MLLEILPVLKFIHEQQIIHRDIKPENIMRRSDGLFMLIDFGVSKQLSGTVMTQPGTQIGSWGYAPLEQMQSGKAYPASDLFSLGATAFHLLTGVNPFNLWTEHGYSWTANWQQYSIAPLSHEFQQILNRLLQKDIQQRYRSAAAVLQDLQHQSTPNPRLLIRARAMQIPGFPLPDHHPPAPKSRTNLQRFDFEAVTVDLRGNLTNRQRYQAQFMSEDLGGGVILEMVLIPGGTFVMGSPKSEAGRDISESPQHQVIVPAFYMGKYPITQEQYQAVMGNDSSFFKGAKRPVEQVSWHDSVEFCQRISQKTGKTYCLPSEAQWEYSCRAGTTTHFYFGETVTPDLANYNGNYPYASVPKGIYRQETTDVGSFPPNAFGLYDMHGTVWEWCSDRWHYNYSGAPSDGSSWEAGTDDNRVLRGGSWGNYSVNCRSASRNRNAADLSSKYTGFRVAGALLSKC
jgi:formylglycine-generating enzyme required for sulfatase activity